VFGLLSSSSFQYLKRLLGSEPSERRGSKRKTNEEESDETGGLHGELLFEQTVRKSNKKQQ
jgi:hypothetical protein